VSSSSIALPASASAVLRRRGDAALRSRAARGSEAAFAVVYERHHQALYRYCRSIVGHDEDAHDALQNTMTRAFAALQHEERDFELRPWLFRIAHNESISLLRQRRSTRELDEAHDIGTDALTQTVEVRRQLAELRSDLDQLPERQRGALVLRELSGLSHEEIAVVLESSPRAVKQTIFEARVALLEHREGREMDCEPCRRALSDGDKRVLRGRRIRSHLRSCAICQGFQADLQRRPGQLALLAPPIPLAAGAAMAAHLLGAGAKSSAAVGASSASPGLMATVTGKVAAAAAVAATATGGAIAAPRVAPIFSSAPTVGSRAPAAVAPSGTGAGPARSALRPAGITSAPGRHSPSDGQRAGSLSDVPQSATRAASDPANAGRTAVSSGSGPAGTTPVATTPDAHAVSGHDRADAGRSTRAAGPRSQDSPATTKSSSGRGAGSGSSRDAPAQSAARTGSAKARHAPSATPPPAAPVKRGGQATAGSDHAAALTPSGSAPAQQGSQPTGAAPASPAVTGPPPASSAQGTHPPPASGAATH
jgi:RNA polymerase sigma factor (sigma-70 family)